MKKARFTGTVLEGHKAAGIEVPFDPAERWSIAAVRLRKGRNGHRVRATIGEATFDSEIVPRMKRFFLVLPDEADVAPGDEVTVELAPR